ncbi:MAG: hypothetical protein KGI75_02400 [Rhizobiaceae bacterium]|nr:hypothetical protein [Rhizobiaceae bacterium]
MIMEIYGIALALALAMAPVAHADSMDLTSIKAIAISGDASRTHVSTNADAAYRIETGSDRGGWFSHWYSIWSWNICRDVSRMHVEGTTLYIDTGSSSWLDRSDCRAEIDANVPAGATVEIDQQALDVKLDGDFARVRIAVRAGDISLNGHASALAIKGEALQARLSYDKVLRDEVVAIDAKLVDAYVDFGRDTPLEYSVAAMASSVDSARPSVTGARPSIDIKGMLVSATIR